MDTDLDFAFRLADLADEEAMRRWSPSGVAASFKRDGSPVTEADVAAETAILEAVQRECPDDGFIGEEVRAHAGSNDRRWIIDGIDGTNFFADGSRTWGTLIALEYQGEIVVGVSSSPAQARRWWATRGGGAFTNGIGVIQRGVLRTLGLEDAFDVVVISSGVGVNKPSAAFFDVALSELGVSDLSTAHSLRSTPY